MLDSELIKIKEAGVKWIGPGSGIGHRKVVSPLFLEGFQPSRGKSLSNIV